MSSKLTTIWWLKKSQRNDKRLEKERLPVITWTKKDSSKQVASIPYKLEKKKILIMSIRFNFLLAGI